MELVVASADPIRFALSQSSKRLDVSVAASSFNRRLRRVGMEPESVLPIKTAPSQIPVSPRVFRRVNAVKLQVWKDLTAVSLVSSLACKELIPEAGAGKHMLLCDSCIPPKEPDSGHTQIADIAPRSPLLVDSSSPIRYSTQPVSTESKETSCRSQPQIKRQGKITRKDLRMHKSVFA